MYVVAVLVAAVHAWWATIVMTKYVLSANEAAIIILLAWHGMAWHGIKLTMEVGNQRNQENTDPLSLCICICICICMDLMM